MQWTYKEDDYNLKQQKDETAELDQADKYIT